MASRTRRISSRPRRRPRPDATSPPGVHAVGRLDQVRVLAHPLRLRLLEIFATQTATTKQVAAMLGESPTRLYHHVYALERVGLVTLTETRPNRGTVERYYRAVAQRLTLEEPLARGSTAPKRRGGSAVRAAVLPATRPALALELLERAEREFVAATEGRVAADLAPLLARIIVRGTPAQIQRVRADLIRWLGDVKGRLGDAPSAAAAQSYALTMAFLPTSDGATGAGATRAKRAASRGRARASRRRRVP